MSDSPLSGAGYRWTCPICDQSRLNTSGEQNGVSALRSHLLASGGAGHGPVNEYPVGFDPDALSEHVVRLGGREDPVQSNR